MKVKIRGIYATALTQLLKENGVDIIQPSSVIDQRFDINGTGSATTIVYDKDDLNGITISGSNATEVTDIIFKKLTDSAVKKMEIGEIYCGKIKRIEKQNNQIIVDLGDEEGILPFQSYWGFLKEGEKVLVQVKGRYRSKKILSTKLRIFGQNAILIKDGFTKISRYIKTESEKKKLEKINSEFSGKGWGILWKSFAEGKSEDELRKEIEHLYSQEKEISEKFNQMNEVGLIKEGVKIYTIEFGAISKKELDDLRKKVITTIPGHHFLKSGNYSIVVDFAESLENIDYNIISNKLNKVLMKNGPHPGKYYEIIQKKVNGRDIILKGFVESFDGEELTIKRKLYAGKKYDGIGGQIMQGDYALTKINPNSWIVKHTYFDKNGIQKGVYFNINTPVEIYPAFARYIDLEVDVVKKGDTKEIIDKDKLERVLSDGIIKKELADKAMEIANKIMKGETK